MLQTIKNWWYGKEKEVEDISDIKLIIINVSEKTITITKSVTPEDAALALMTANSAPSVPQILEENGHEQAFERMNAVVRNTLKNLISDGTLSLKQSFDEDDDSPAISPTDAIKGSKL